MAFPNVRRVFSEYRYIQMTDRQKTTRPLRVAFLHPDLGIGGAERLIVDAAVGLQNQHIGGTPKYDITIFTSHHDHKHCYSETIDQLKVVVYGDWLPTQLPLIGGGAIIFAILRNLWAALMITLFWSPFDVIIVDQLSVCHSVLRLRAARRLLFYCHFPDMHLAKGRDSSLIKRLYRLPFDWIERQTTAMADRVLVNSRYTAQVYRETFADAVHRYGLIPHVLHPAVNDHRLAEQQKLYVATNSGSDGSGTEEHKSLSSSLGVQQYRIFVSINRYERKKNIGLTIRALKELENKLTPKRFGELRIRLVIAGGFDGERVAENREVYHELKTLACEYNFSFAEPEVGAISLDLSLLLSGATIVFVRSFSDQQKVQLLNQSLAVLYTPENEHFGIVPVEAMYFRRPVIANASGGPLESIIASSTRSSHAAKTVDTGYLIGSLGPVDANNNVSGGAAVVVAPPGHNQYSVKTPAQAGSQARYWAAAMHEMVENPDLVMAMGANGHKRVIDTFSMAAFANKLDDSVAITLTIVSKTKPPLG